jgi:hypothetical protein
VGQGGKKHQAAGARQLGKGSEDCAQGPSPIRSVTGDYDARMKWSVVTNHKNRGDCHDSCGGSERYGYGGMPMKLGLG